MEKNILNEIDQMKYLFGYKAGKVISEQVNPTTPPQTGETKPSFATINGVVYKLPGITDVAKLENFTSIGKVADLVKSMGIDIIAKLGITPERLKDRGVQDTMMRSNYGPYLKYALEPGDEEGPVITRDNYFNKLADIVSYKMKSL